jgi:hypothetical protein
MKSFKELREAKSVSTRARRKFGQKPATGSIIRSAFKFSDAVADLDDLIGDVHSEQGNREYIDQLNFLKGNMAGMNKQIDAMIKTAKAIKTAEE